MEGKKSLLETMDSFEKELDGFKDGIKRIVNLRIKLIGSDSPADVSKEENFPEPILNKIEYMVHSFERLDKELHDNITKLEDLFNIK